MTTSNARIERSLGLLRQNLVDGNYYEGHQELRAIAVRLVKQKKHERAVQLLYLGALELCQYNQWGSVADLAAFMINIYVEEKVPVTDESRERVCEILERLSQATEYYPRVYEAATQWAIKAAGDSVGDVQLHHFIGCLLRNKGRYQEAEQHFLVGTPESAAALGGMLFDWAARTAASDYGLFAARGVLKYLAAGWYDAAGLCWRAFAARLAQHEAAGAEQRSGGLDTKAGPVYRSAAHELANAVQLVLLAVERADGSPSSQAARVFGQIRSRYESRFGDNGPAVHELLDAVAERYFGVVVQRQPSLFDLVSSFLDKPAPPSIGSGEAMD
ncbi:hypothetical protein H4R18_000616 [Coemansia javaensis]|uniref:DUF410-domain-containing protein n=1 Tax=Coemansia javaensis TaxID=2761396 RepID=A0A9W8LLG1_9FUNG|nr:hypothetical protein H4R18_000616 [Coemansia javaensis]